MLIVVLKWSILNVNVDRIISPRHGVQGVAVLWSAVCWETDAGCTQSWQSSTKCKVTACSTRYTTTFQLIKVTTLDSRVLS